jgi:N-acetylglucosaminyl-diphospho-decaprenol L-rhamnosyltransferase
MTADVSVSIICTDNRDMLRDCLVSLYETTKVASAEVFVVDNASGDGTSEMLAREFPQVQVIRNEDRLGFASNNNLVLKRATGRYVMLLNDDTLLLPGALDTLVEFMDAHPEATVAGGQLLNPDGSAQICFNFFPHPVIEAFHPFTDRWRVVTAPSDEPLEVDWVCGASLMARREVVDQVGPLDTAFDPIYSEETDWCYRIRQSGGCVFAVPAARFIHFGGQTMDRLPTRRVELLYAKRALYFQKHHGRGARWLFKGALWLASLAKLLGWIALFPLRPGQARLKIPLHWHMVRRALWL